MKFFLTGFSLRKKFFSLQAGLFLIFVFPASTNYQLKDFGFGTGGVSNATSGSYALDALSGEQSAGNLDGTTYDLGSGLIYTNQANVPPAPTFTNPSNYYNKLKIVLDTGGNPSDTLFAIAISTDNFVSDTKYVQSDDTVGISLGIEDYQTFANWGGTPGGGAYHRSCREYGIQGESESLAGKIYGNRLWPGRDCRDSQPANNV